MSTALLAGATLASAVLAIASALGLLAPGLLFVFKPLTTALILCHAARARAERPARRWVIAGLALSWCGDVALLWPQRGFLPGLVCFLLAHVAYLVAFTRPVRLAARPAPFIVYAAVAGGVLALLWPDVPAGLKPPVAVYVVFLAAMAAQAAVVWRTAADGGDRPAGGLAAGGALFVLSDALLATNRFQAALPWASLWILASYWAAQWCIASWGKPALRRS
ncbi:lysoplasmalogenase [Piscinibacter sp. XHJ-5]|uniref:lysoplasmalogenase n=1 Tax=Piscinibacter sp. XHJ-5 TaxID=3037797 RepID=UPI002452D26F|nr:lysoplasmalogenase [Piscinibacter sp. XHJ-5]